MRDELLALAARVEGAEGPSRKLDALIWCALNGKKYAAHCEAYSEPAATQVEYTEPPKRTRLVTRGGHPRLSHAQPVTASLDAAMKLVLEGCKRNMRLQWTTGAHGQPCVTADLRWFRVNATAATPALALTAACLRALAAQDTGHE